MSNDTYPKAEREEESPSIDSLINAAALIGLDFSRAECKLMQAGVAKYQAYYRQLRQIDLTNSVTPALYFQPAPPRPAAPAGPATLPLDLPRSSPPPVRPDDLDSLAFYPVTELARLIKSGQISAVELTELYLDRLKRYGPRLECVVTLTEDLALAQARRADAELAAGRYLGPLHGIPWGAKDLLATRGIPTTWGAPPYREQIFDFDATVVQRLEAAGAVLVAKLTMGSLAWGDVWFGGKTRTPWNLAEGSSGSSAGSGAATAAGLVGFAIGTETHGSIVTPSTRCGISGLRPTFGRVSRYGAMALSWSMDKIGPMARTAEDCALIFQAIYGPDGHDPTVIERPFAWPVDLDLATLRIGYVESAFAQESPTQLQDEQTLATLRRLGAQLIPIELPQQYPLEALNLCLFVEAAAAFDDLTRSNRDDLLVRQGVESWPNRFRQARLVPAVEYIQANRIRSLVMQEMASLLADIDLYLAPSFGNSNMLLTNLTGHPAIVVPNGLNQEKGLPTSITFTGRLYDEARLLAVAQLYQAATDFHRQPPPLE